MSRFAPKRNQSQIPRVTPSHKATGAALHALGKYHSSIARSVGVNPAWVMPGTWGLEGTSERVVVHGEIDLVTAGGFEEQASEAVMRSEVGNFLIDLSGVTFMDSAGVTALIRVLELRDGQRIIVQPSRQVFTLLHLCGLTNGGAA